jgi:hypothetical protein
MTSVKVEYQLKNKRNLKQILNNRTNKLKFTQITKS